MPKPAEIHNAEDLLAWLLIRNQHGVWLFDVGGAYYPVPRYLWAQCDKFMKITSNEKVSP